MTKEEKISALFTGEPLYFNDNVKVHLEPNSNGQMWVIYQDDHNQAFHNWIKKINLDEWSLEPPENKKEYIHVYLDDKNQTCVSSKTGFIFEDYINVEIERENFKEFIKTIEV